MLRFVVSALAANKMLVRRNSNVSISNACLTLAGISPHHDIIGTTSLGTSEARAQAGVGRNFRMSCRIGKDRRVSLE